MPRDQLTEREIARRRVHEQTATEKNNSAFLIGHSVPFAGTVLGFLFPSLGTAIQNVEPIEITDPATGKFIFIPEISDPNGTDIKPPGSSP